MELPLFNRVSHRCPINYSLRLEVTAQMYVTLPQTICLMVPAMWQHLSDYQQQSKQVMMTKTALHVSLINATLMILSFRYNNLKWFLYCTVTICTHIHTDTYIQIQRKLPFISFFHVNDIWKEIVRGFIWNFPW